MDIASITSAPEIKAVPDRIEDAFDGFMSAFDAFKDANDRRLDEIERKLSSDVVTRDKVDRINKVMDEQKKALDQLVLKRARPALGGGDISADQVEHKAAFETYIRRGDESGLRALEEKAFSTGAASDGGCLVPNETDTEIGRRLSVVSPIRALATVRQVSYAASLTSTLWPSQSGVNLNLWRKPEVCDAIRDFIT